MKINHIYNENCLTTLERLEDRSINCCITSPPYFGLRDYGVDGQIGLESSPEEFVSKMVEIFREVRRVLMDDGTLWLNLGDSYSGSGKGPAGNLGKINNERHLEEKSGGIVPVGMKQKDLMGIPWMVAFALRADGWYLRQDIIWAKPNPMPESVKDRCTKSHEYIFLLSKSPKYYYDYEAIKEPVTQSTLDRLSQPTLEKQAGSDGVPGKVNGNMKATIPKNLKGNGQKAHTMHEVRFGGSKYGDNDDERYRTKSGNIYELKDAKRNKRSVWNISTKPYKEARFATFPSDLIVPCVLAGCPEDGIVYDPFMGSGTTGEVAYRAGRNFIDSELNSEYCEISKKRLAPHIEQGDIFKQIKTTHE